MGQRHAEGWWPREDWKEGCSGAILDWSEGFDRGGERIQAFSFAAM